MYSQVKQTRLNITQVLLQNALTKIIVIWYVIFYGLPNSLILKLQGIQNACARYNLGQNKWKT